MKNGRPMKVSFGWIAVDCILIAGVIMSIQTGQLALNKWCMIAGVSVVFGILLVKMLKKRTEKERKRFKSTKVEEYTSADSNEEG